MFNTDGLVIIKGFSNKSIFKREKWRENLLFDKLFELLKKAFIGGLDLQ